VIVAIPADDSGTPAGLSMAGGTSRTQDLRRALMLDRCAGDAYRAGNHSQALRLLALARAADPSMASQLDERRALASAARRAAEPPGRPLAEVVASRLAEAGVTPDDPALRRIAEHNAQVQARAGVHPLPLGPVGESEGERFRQQLLDAAAQMEAGS
jgi:hypothetical protein